MIRKVLAVLALGSALTVLAPTAVLASDRDDRRSEQTYEHRDRENSRVRNDRYDQRYRRGDGDEDDRGPTRQYRNPQRNNSGYYDQYGYWHTYRR